ncbi:MAG TPA: helix-turn-helix domain-containing protein [Pedobacter sp.]|nr:helix-turn-helix domain-containing protein [Pedobacter sp.]
MLVQSELSAIGIENCRVELGEVYLNRKFTPQERTLLAKALKPHGMEILEDKKSKLIEKIKNVIIEAVHFSNQPVPVKFSAFLEKKLGYDYKYMSTMFSEVKGISIEHYLISHKIERVKELLIYDQLSLTTIANMLCYSSVAHLSTQFKKTTGITPSVFKTMKEKRRIAREDL